MNARFYAPGHHAPGATVVLPADESAHAIRTLRLGVGDAVRVFDGTGNEFDATIVQLHKQTVEVAIGQPRQPAAEALVAVTLVQAVLKGNGMDAVVRDAVMMGAAAIEPMVTSRSEISLAALERGGRHERWERVAVSSAKQCGRAVVPLVAAPVMLEQAAALQPDVVALMCVEPGAAGGQAVPIGSLPDKAPNAVRLFVGPEGGWTTEEVSQLARTATLVSLGGRTLRADAVAIVALAALFTHWRAM